MTGRRINAERGGIAVEFGVLFPLIALLIAGSIWFGLMFSAQLSLTQSARESVRTYALGSGDHVVTATAAFGVPGVLTDGLSVDQGIVQPDGSLAGDCIPASPGTPAPNAGVRVSTTFTFNIGFLPFPSIELDAQAVMRCGG